jgi:hypothetical protein
LGIGQNLPTRMSAIRQPGMAALRPHFILDFEVSPFILVFRF